MPVWKSHELMPRKGDKVIWEGQSLTVDVSPDNIGKATVGEIKVPCGFWKFLFQFSWDKECWFVKDGLKQEQKDFYTQLR